jgi:hypothetical protein
VRAGGPTPGADTAPPEAAVDLAASGNLARGLTDRTLLGGRGLGSLRLGAYTFFVQPYYQFGSVTTPVPGMGDVTKRTDNELYVRTALFRTITGPLFGFVVAVGEHSLRRQIDERGLFGGGVGVTIVHGPCASLVVSASLDDEPTRWAVAPMFADGVPVDASRNIAREVTRIYGQYTLGHVSLTHDLYLAPSLTHAVRDYRILLYAAAEVPLVAGFAGRVQVDASHEEVIVPGSQHDDLALTFGVAYRRTWTHH